jgi:hypothetical protein
MFVRLLVHSFSSLLIACLSVINIYITNSKVAHFYGEIYIDSCVISIPRNTKGSCYTNETTWSMFLKFIERLHFRL